MCVLLCVCVAHTCRAVHMRALNASEHGRRPDRTKQITYTGINPPIYISVVSIHVPHTKSTSIMCMLCVPSGEFSIDGCAQHHTPFIRPERARAVRRGGTPHNTTENKSESERERANV